ncbi:TPA: hypothetical protein ACMEVF_001618 [Klebsiella variicola subsp. variicola]
MSETNGPARTLDVRPQGSVARRKAKSLLESRLLKFGSSDWTRTSSMSPVISGVVKVARLSTNIFTIIIVFLSLKCQLKTISCCHNLLTICVLPCFHYQNDVVVITEKVINIKQLVIF